MIRLPAWPFGRARAQAFDYTAPIKFSGVTKRFGSKIALDNLDVVIPAGRVTALVGPDGAGKSTTLRLIAGSLVPTEGRIVVGGLDVVRHTGDVQAHLGFVPSRRLLYSDLTIAENLAFFAGLYPAEPVAMAERRASLLDLMDLTRFTDRLAGNLSGGMRQKLALACALQHDPGVLLMDEPTTGGISGVSSTALTGMVSRSCFPPRRWMKRPDAMRSSSWTTVARWHAEHRHPCSNMRRVGS